MLSANGRLTIQTDLNGFSFKIYDKNGLLLHTERRDAPIDLFKEERDSLLLKSYSFVNVFVSSGKSTLIPSKYYLDDGKREILSEITEIEENDEVMSLEIPSQKAVIVYAVDKQLISMILSHYKNVRFYPIIYLLIDRISSINVNNRLLMTYAGGMVHIVAAEREKLLLANSYPASDIVTAEYFLLSVSKEVMFNPEHTKIHVFGNMGEADRKDLSKYFSGIVLLQ